MLCYHRVTPPRVVLSCNLPFVCRYDVSIACEDSGRPRMTSQSQLTVHVTDANDHAPQFVDHDFYSVELSETTPVGTEVVRLKAADPDSGENGRVTYRIDDDAASKLFAVDAETGVVRTLAALDRETAAEHRFVVAAVDAGNRPRSSTAIVEVVVGDVDDELPRFSLSVYALRVAENRPPGSEVGAVAARDSDGEPFNDFRFRLIADNVSAAFKIDFISGLITTLSPLDREQRALYRLTVVAEPTGTTSSSGTSSTAVVNVQVNDCSYKIYVIVSYRETASNRKFHVTVRHCVFSVCQAITASS